MPKTMIFWHFNVEACLQHTVRDFFLYQSAMNNKAMTTHLSPNQSLETDSSAQESPMPNDVLNNNDLPDNQTMIDEQVHDTLDNDDLLEENSDIDEGVDESDMDDSDIEDGDDEASVAGQAVPVVVDMTHIVTEDESGLRIDKVASQVFSDFSRVQIQG